MSVSNLCSGYTNYLRIDCSTNIKSVEESIDETLTRLEEFESLFVMVKSDVESQLSQSILDKQGDLKKICQRVIFLEELVTRVKESVDLMEAAVSEAESELKTTTEGRLKSMIKPLLFMKSNLPQRPSTNREPFVPPSIFSTSDFFINYPT